MDDFRHIREILLSSGFFCEMKRRLSWKRFQIHLQKYSSVCFSQFEENFRLRRFMLARDNHNEKTRQTTTWGGLSSLYWDLLIWSGYRLHLGPNENLICRQLYRRSKKCIMQCSWYLPFTTVAMCRNIIAKSRQIEPRVGKFSSFETKNNNNNGKIYIFTFAGNYRN